MKKPRKVSKPVIIDYPENRELLKREFAKIASTPGFNESVEMARDVLYGRWSNQKTSLKLFQRKISSKENLR